MPSRRAVNQEISVIYPRIHPTLPFLHVRRRISLALLLAAVGSVGCHRLTDVSDPTAVLEKDVDNPDGAERLRNSVYYALNGNVGGVPAYITGFLTDEFRYELDPSNPTLYYEDLDRRRTEDAASLFDDYMYPQLQELWGLRTSVAIEKLRDYALPGAREAHVGEMYAIRAFIALRLGEQYCPGFPLHTVAHYKIVAYSGPLTTDQVFEKALAAFDTAATWAVDSARVLNFARVGRGRALLDLGRFTDAAAAVTSVPTDYVMQLDDSSTILSNWNPQESIADGEGGHGLNYVSAHDPRVQTVAAGTSAGGNTSYKFAQPRVQWFASGVEARLIEAEVALHANPNGNEWLAILNTLRTAGPDGSGGWLAGTGGVAGLAPLSDPGTPDARVDLVYRERAFWLFAMGSRIGDLRRLVRVYGRSVDSVFPSGSYWRGGAYGTGTSLPFSKVEMQRSPGITGCTTW